MNKLDKESIVGISALLVHAANIDEIYSEHEKNLIKDFIKSYLKEDDTDNSIDQYESNLMRRICGLIYFPDKECAEIKMKLINK